MESAQKRLREQGWDRVRPALSVTVRSVQPLLFFLSILGGRVFLTRGFILRAFLEGTVRGNSAATIEFLSRSIEILEWGQRVWKDVPRTERGTIFDDTFVRGVRSMYLDALMQVSRKFSRSINIP